LASGLKFSWHGSAPFVKRFMPALKNFEPCHTIDSCKSKHMMKCFDDCWC
jgi:hypothetical protein